MLDSTTTVSRTQLLFGLCLALAALVGFLIADPLRYSSLVVLGLLLGVLIWPLVVKWHHVLLIASLNSVFILPFLPGNLPIWALLAGVGFCIVLLNRCLDRELTLFHPGGVGWALAALGVVVMVTAVARGGIGLKAFGSETQGGKKYLMILLSVAAYFVLASKQVPPGRRMLYLGLFMLMALTQLLSHVFYMAGEKFYWAYQFIDSAPVMGQVAVDWQIAGEPLFRSPAIGDAAGAVCSWFLATRGMRGLLNIRRPWPLLLTVLCIGVGMVGGFRSFLVALLLTYVVMFFLEGLHRTWYLGLALVLVLALGALTVAFAEKLPNSLQRSLSFLPIKVDPMARQDAEGSLAWRMDMWREVSKEVQPNLLLGKGYAVEASDLQFADWNTALSYAPLWEWAALTGEYHNGPLSVMVPFGIWGALTFGWFLVAGLLRLRWHYKNSQPEMLCVNRALLVFFIVQMIFFLFLFGSLYSGLVRFVFLVGLAECLNAPAFQPVKQEAEVEPLQEIALERGETL